MLISIVIVTYNAEKTICKSLESVLSQKGADYEIVVIDGKSTDKTVNIVKEIAFQNPLINIVIVSEPDDGIYDAMNKARYFAKGEYIYYLGSGDMLHDDNVLSRISNSISINDFPDMVYGDVVFIYENKEEYFPYGTRRQLHLLNMAFQRGVCHQALFARRELLEKHGFENRYLVHADLAWMVFWLKNKATKLAVSFPIAKYDTTGVSSNTLYTAEGYKEADMLVYDICPLLAYLQRPVKVILRACRNRE